MDFGARLVLCLVGRVLILIILRGPNPVIIKSRGFIAFSALGLGQWVVMRALAEAWVQGSGSASGQVGVGRVRLRELASGHVIGMV